MRSSDLSTRQPPFLRLRRDRMVQAANGGLFVSRGKGTHPTRIIDSWELILVRSGTLSMQEAGRPIVIEKDQSLLLRPGVEHGGIAPYSKNLSFYWIHFRPPKSSAGSGAVLRVPQVGSPRRFDRLTDLLHRFLDEQETGTLQPMTADLLVTLMLCEVADSAGADLPSSAASLAGRAMAHIAAHADDSLATATLAELLQCNADYLGRVFLTAHGQTITQAIHRQRCRDARRLLLDGTLNVNQVAAACAFASTGYFRRVFKKYEGLTPRQYRRLYRRMHINWR